MQPLADSLPTAIFSSAQVRALDAQALEQFAIPSFDLMTRAGEAALAALLNRWPDARALLVYCGAGNNAGDGYVLARLAKRKGLDVRVVAVVEPGRLHGDAASAWAACREAGVTAHIWPDLPEPGFAAQVSVDALLGTGLRRDLDPVYLAAVAHINAADIPVLALDIPSGLDADSGMPRGAAVRAALTITFVGLKQGLFLGYAADYCGDLVCADLDIPRAAAAGLAPVMTRLGPEVLTAALPPRRRTAHKAAHGRLLLVGGGPGMGGAIRLAAEGALRAGAGLVYVGTHPSNVGAVAAGRPEIICHGIAEPVALDALIECADAFVLGPGLGHTQWAQQLWLHVIGIPQRGVVDADGLNLLSRHSLTRADWILTPHPGEAARLLGVSTAAVGCDRLGAVVELARRYQAVAVLKGACSLVAQANDSNDYSVAVCDKGNPGMATGGTGDVLAGVIGALLAQGCDLALAARAGVLLHALAGDDAAAGGGERGLLASDLFTHIRRRANPR